MRKLNLAAPCSERDAVLNALRDTGAAELKEVSFAEALPSFAVDTEEAEAYLLSMENTLATLSEAVSSYARKNKVHYEPVKDGFGVSYTEFLNAAVHKEAMEALRDTVNGLVEERNELKAQLSKTERSLSLALPFRTLTTPFSDFSSTPHTVTELGTLSAAVADEVFKAFSEEPLIDFRILNKNAEFAVVVCIYHKTAEKQAELLHTKGFTSCPFTNGETGKELYKRLTKEWGEWLVKADGVEQAFFSLHGEIRTLKLYCDFLGAELEKKECSRKMRTTDHAVLMEAFVPAGSEEKIRAALSSVPGIYFEFSDVGEEEEAPTLLKNNPIVENFESVTNMYSPPARKELDPNPIMAVFYSVFFGFIMADIGYGIVLLLGGGFLWYKNRMQKGGLKSLAGIFAFGGVFAIVWGILFNSLFGISVLPFTVMPDAQSAMWKFAGISLPSILVVSLILGVIHLMAGYVCRAVQSFRWGRLWDGICDGMTWALFSLGVELAVLGLVEELNLSFLLIPGAGIAGGSLVAAMATAGRREKLMGKFAKGFGALYGVIGYVSDILSYARLYGLMLSGAIIAQIVSRYSLQFIASGSFFMVLGVFLMVFGHVLNLAIALLGAYIHDARLQYVEFYGRFYIGDGVLFAPLGSTHKYISILPEEKASLPVGERQTA